MFRSSGEHKALYNDLEFKQLKATMSASFRELHKKLDERESILGEILENTFKRNNERKKKRNSELEKLQRTFDAVESNLSDTSLIETGTEALKPIQARINELEKEGNVIQFGWDTSALEQAINELGSFVIISGHEDELLMDHIENGSPVSPARNDIDIPNSIIEYPSNEPRDYLQISEPFLSVGLTGSDPGQLKSSCGLAVDDQARRIFVADYKNRRIQIFTFDGDCLAEFGESDLFEPYGLCVRGDTIYVTDLGHNAYLTFSIKSQKLISRTGSEGEANGQFDVPYGIDIDSENKLIYVCDCLNNRVSLFDQTSNQFRKNVGANLLHLPNDVKVTPNSIFVLDQNTVCIHNFDKTTGAKLSSFITRGPDKQVEFAYFFCIDAHGNIVLSDRDQNCLKVFSPTGVTICIVGEKGDEPGQFHYPEGIALTTEGKIVSVCSEKTRNILQIL